MGRSVPFGAKSTKEASRAVGRFPNLGDLLQLRLQMPTLRLIF
jgi:hypothetical protein